MDKEKSKYYFEENPFDIVKQLRDDKSSQAWKHIFLSKVDAIYNLLNPQKNTKILDVGCGTGYSSLIHDFRLNQICNEIK